NWFNLSDRQMEDALYEIDSMRRFAGFGGTTDALPDEITILNFRHLLERHELTAVLLEVINTHLKTRGLLVSKGTMMSATLIHAQNPTGQSVLLWHEGTCWGRRQFRGGAHG
ncbi:MAG TPA: transposase, partial [Nitrosomonas sp.]|nr:transposase [Nitrosomonas sp.]